MKKEKSLEEKRKELINVFMQKKNKIFSEILFILILFFGIFLRTRNLDELKGKHLLGLDPYLFLRYARHIAEHGSIMAHDAVRYYPLGFNTKSETMLVSYVIGYAYRILNFFNKKITLNETAIFYPVICFVIGIIIYYLFTKKLFNTKIALLSSMILVVMPPYLYRMNAGFADKEPLAVALMFLVFYFFYAASDSDQLKKIAYYSLAGLFTGLMAVTWGGTKFVLLIIPAYTIMLAIFNKTNKNDFFGYIIWLILFSIFAVIFTTKYGGLKGIVSSTTTSFAFVIAIFLGIKTFVPGNIFRKKFFLYGTIPGTIIISIIFFTTSTGKNIVYEIFKLLTKGMAGERLMVTVAEARQPMLYDWLSATSFFFFFLIIGSGYLVWKNSKLFFGKNESRIISSIFVFMVIGIIFSRLSEGSVFNGSSVQSEVFMFVPVIVFGLAIIYFSAFSSNKKNFEKAFGNVDKAELFLIIWFMVMLLAARSGVRLFLIFVPTVAIVSSLIIIKLFSITKKINNNIYRYSILTILFIVVWLPILGYAQYSYLESNDYKPSFDRQWQDTAEWINTSTPRDSVFAQWWDYGYWIQTEGERSTITDGGNFIPYWNHLMARKVLASENFEEALKFLYAHNATYLLITAEEIKKYEAYSAIGSDENFDIMSWISVFNLDPDLTQKNGSVINYFFTGQYKLDDDLNINKKVFKKKNSWIYKIKVPVDESFGGNDRMKILQPTAYIASENNNDKIKINCVYDEGIHNFGINEPKENNKTKRDNDYRNDGTNSNKGIDSCLRIFPYYINNMQKQENGAMLYLSEKGRKTLWARLYLFNESNDFFEPVYQDFPEIAMVGDDVAGPIKIWKINYPKNFTITKKLRNEYLNKTTPEWMKLTTILAE